MTDSARPFRSGEPVLTPDGWGYVGNPIGTPDYVIVQLIRSDGWETKGFAANLIFPIADELRDIANNINENTYDHLLDMADAIERGRPVTHTASKPPWTTGRCPIQ